MLAQDLNQIVNLLNGTTTDTQVTVANRIRANLTGATGSSGYVGGVAGAAPTSGSFGTGDFVVDSTNGCFWVCTQAGTPGTWKRVGTSSYVARRHQSATTQNVANGFTHPLNLDVQDYDPKGMWNTLTKAFVIPFSGATWRITARVSVSLSVSNVRFATLLYLNGSEMTRGLDAPTGTTFGGGMVSDLQQLSSGDSITLGCYCENVGTTESAAPGARVFMEIALVDQ